MGGHGQCMAASLAGMADAWLHTWLHSCCRRTCAELLHAWADALCCLMSLTWTAVLRCVHARVDVMLWQDRLHAARCCVMLAQQCASKGSASASRTMVAQGAAAPSRLQPGWHVLRRACFPVTLSLIIAHTLFPSAMCSAPCLSTHPSPLPPRPGLRGR